MEGSLINIDLGEFGKAANTLVEKISGAAGILYKPRAIVKQAKADSKARIIEAKTDIEIGELQSRTLARVINQEERKQLNYENIIRKTLDVLPENAKPENIDEDWLAYFFDKCSSVSDDDMQYLWSNLLSQEAEVEGRFSKRTVDFISTMSKKEAQQFSELCGFIIYLHDKPYIVINDLDNGNQFGSGLRYSDLVHMESIGLLSFSSSCFQITELPKAPKVTYHDRTISLLLPETVKEDCGYVLDIGGAVLTPLGHELSQLCQSNINEEFYDSIIKVWEDLNFIDHTA